MAEIKWDKTKNIFKNSIIGLIERTKMLLCHTMIKK